MAASEPLTGANAWNESGNLLLSTAPGVLIWPATMLTSMAMSLVDSRLLRKITIAMCIVLVIFMFYFFRNPAVDRSGYGALGQYDMVSPACGTVLIVDQVPMDQVAADYGPLVGFTKTPDGAQQAVIDKAAWRIAIGMSLLDRHYQAMPMDATLKSTTYKQGTFEPVFFLEKSEYNERCALQFVPGAPNDPNTAPVASFYVVLIAGMIARTITLFPNADPGTALSRGAKFGMIQFGSRVDLIIPIEYKILCNIGQRVVVGETLLATIE